MAISKLVLNGVTQMDLTTDTVTNSAHIMSGYIGHLADGTQITGTGQGGNSSSGQTIAGTITGNGTSTLEISCAFEPDVIDIYGDMSDDVTKRGTIRFTMIKDTVLYYGSDSSQSTSNATITVLPITGYNESETSLPHASYSNGTLTVSSGSNSSSNLWLSGQTYTYELGVFGSGSSAPSATQHTIHLGFSDSTSTDINVYYNDTLLNTMITAYKPKTYGLKTVTLAQLDNVTWYEPVNIPIGTELIDYSKVTSDCAIKSSGEIEAQEWMLVSDYTPVETGMTFTYTGCLWFYLNVYDDTKTLLNTIYIYNDATVDENDSNTGHGTLSGAELPASAAYVRITATGASSQYLSLIRTA